MKLYIRSQDRLKMEYVNGLEAYEYNDKFTIEVNGIDFGEYNSKERAIEILDEIQKLLILNYMGVYEMPEE